jgi:hypothetical protein
MLPLLLALVITSTPDVAKLGKAPALPPWPDGLPAAVQQTDAAVLLPKLLADAVHARLELLDLYPSMCQSALDTSAALAEEKAEADLDAALAKAQAKALQEAAEPRPAEWQWYDKAAAIIGAGALGFSIGFFVHAVAH